MKGKTAKKKKAPKIAVIKTSATFEELTKMMASTPTPKKATDSDTTLPQKRRQNVKLGG